MWIQFLTPQMIEMAGENRRFSPGDWADLGKALALRLIAQGAARTLSSEIITGFPDAGIVCTAEPQESLAFPFVVEEPSLLFERTLIWEPTLPLRMDLLPIGFHLLERWEMAVPIASLTDLALSLGTAKERKETQRIIRDLRVPYYDTRIIFARRCSAAEQVIRYWSSSTGNKELAFLRAIYLYKPVLCALPVTWVGVSL